MTCRICGNSENNTTYQAREMMFGLRTTFTYFQCAACKCLQIAEIPADIAQYYPQDYNGYVGPKSNYYSGLKGKFRKRRYEATLFSQDSFNQTFSSLFPAEQYSLLGMLPMNMETRLLDMGCGTGSFSYPLYELGMKNVMGADPFIPATIVYPNGFKVQKSFISQVQGEWDVIIYNHSFEHVPDPLENLQRVEQILAPDGTCIIRVPTVSSYAWEHYGTDWFQLDAPRHFFLHSIESINVLAQKARLELVDVVYDSTAAQFIHSEKYRLDIPLQEKQRRTFSSFFKRKYKKIKYGRLAKKLNAENQGDQAAFLLKRKK